MFIKIGEQRNPGIINNLSTILLNNPTEVRKQFTMILQYGFSWGVKVSLCRYSLGFERHLASDRIGVPNPHSAVV